MNATKTVSKSDIYRKVAECYENSLRRGDGWHAVRVNTDGEIYVSLEASPCYSEGEYYNREPHTVTVYSTYGRNGADTEEEIAAEMEAMDDDWFKLNVEDLAGNIKKAGLELED